MYDKRLQNQSPMEVERIYIYFLILYCQHHMYTYGLSVEHVSSSG